MRAFAVLVVMLAGCADYAFKRSCSATEPCPTGEVCDLGAAVPTCGPASLTDANVADGFDGPTGALCPLSYGDVGNQHSSYRFLTTQMTWTNAETACEADQMANSTRYTHLAVTFPDTERGLLNAAHPVPSWIGLSDRLTEAFYRWVTNESTTGYPPVTGTPWASGEPAHLSPSDDCVEMNTTADFAESDCLLKLSAWCECDSNLVAPNF